MASIALSLAMGVAAIALIRDTRYQGQDFDVFWRAGSALLHREPLYELGRQGMVFKYPPWVAPAFIPFALLPLSAAKWLWGLICVGALGVALRWVLRQGCSAAVAIGVMIAFWGIWAVHAMDGQIILPILAIALWAGSRAQTPGKGATLMLALSTKVFTLFPVVGRPALWRNRRAWVYGVLAAAVLCLPALLAAPRGHPTALFQSWRVAAESGGTQFGGEKVRGRENQGLPALVLRELNVPARNARADLATALGLALILAVLWAFASRRLSDGSRWAGWLALTPVVHPLAWFHLFVLSFPAVCLSLDRAWRARRWTRFVLAVVGAVAVAAVTRKTLGEFGAELELLAVKSWGVLLCLGVLAWTHSSDLDSVKSSNA